MEFAVRALRGWVPYVGPVAAVARVFDPSGLGSEVMRVAGRFEADGSLHREAECTQAADRVASAA
jgi:hypothetical protein